MLQFHTDTKFNEQTMMMARPLSIFSNLSVMTIWRPELAKIYTQVDLPSYNIKYHVIVHQVLI